MIALQFATIRASHRIQFGRVPAEPYLHALALFAKACAK